MNLLLDTHVVIWWLADPDRLAPDAAAAIRNPDNAIWVSAATAWEIEIKKSLGRLTVPDDLRDQLKRHRFAELPIRMEHPEALRSLPPYHADPFDRILIAQALVENLTLVTRDEKFALYAVPLLHA